MIRDIYQYSSPIYFIENILKRQFFDKKKKWKSRSGLMPSKHVAPKEKVKHCHKTSL